MENGLIDDPTLRAMDQYMTRLSKRQQIVASNIANIDTPGYKTKDISFHLTMEELLSCMGEGVALRTPETNRMRKWNFMPIEHDVFEVSGLPMRVDENNVDIDKEMLKLGETSFGYSMMVQLLRAKLRTIAGSINEGRVGQ